MKKKAKGDGHRTAEKPKGGKTGVNKPVEKASIPQVVSNVRYGKPTQRQKM